MVCRPVAIRLAAIAIVLIALSPAAFGLVFSFSESLEWKVADSDLIVVGRVIRIERQSAEKDPWDLITLEVQRTLKGQPSKTIQFTINGKSESDQALAVQKERAEVLCLLVKSQRRVNERTSEQARRMFDSATFAERDLGFLCTPIKELDEETIDLTELRADAVIQFIENEAKRSLSDPAEGCCDLWVSRGSAYFHRQPISPELLVAPINQQTRSVALRWAQLTDPYDRWNALRVLGTRKSPAAVAALTSMLNDPFLDTEGWPESDALLFNGQGKWEIAEYPLRKAAYKKLAEWEISVAPPVLRQPIYGGAAVRRLYLLLTVVVMSAVFLLAVMKGRRKNAAPTAIGRALSQVSILLLVISILFWIRGRGHIDDLSIPIGNQSRVELASVNGGFRCLLLNRFNESFPALYTTAPLNDQTIKDWDFPNVRPRRRHHFSGFIYGEGSLWMIPTPGYRFITIPWWAICSTFCVISVLRKMLSFARRKRQMRGLCPACGYDLRATPNRCPECGLDVAEVSRP